MFSSLLSSFLLLICIKIVHGTGSIHRQVPLGRSSECKGDVERLCKESEGDDFEAVECLLDHRRNEDEEISSKCHNLLWEFKLNLTRDGAMEKVALSVCPELESKCRVDDQPGHLVSCLLDNGNEATTLECRKLLKRMEKLVFSDYRLVYKFTESCREDIRKTECGRLDDGPTHNQGSTIECLEKKGDIISNPCQSQISRIAELQSEDFHLDRPLFFACRDDRENFCPRVRAGDGRVYRCLMKHRLHPDMSGHCREQLLRREQLTSLNYRVSRGLTMMCRDDIRRYKCHESDEKRGGKRDVRLAHILLCLENALSLDHPVSGECRSEMLVHRQSLMHTFQLTPDMVGVCHKELERCGKRLSEDSIHCLMEGIRDSLHGHPFSSECRRMVEEVLKESNIGEDWRVDPELQSSCGASVDTLCNGVIPGGGRVIDCLLSHIQSTEMAPKCRETLNLIQYFLVRDFDLDATLYTVCHDDAHRFCHAKKEWHKNGGDMDPERGPTVLSCLFRYVYRPGKRHKLSQGCTFEVRRVMRQRALNVQLEPEIEDNCLSDLARFCSEDKDQVTEKGYEMECLQDRFESLSPSCRSVIGNYTEEESEHIELNPHLVKACSEPLKQLCSASSGDEDHGDLMECLILNKHKPIVTSKCFQTIQHFQLISLKDFNFSFKFKQSCQGDVLRYCKSSKTKPQVVHCLSTLSFNDTFTEHSGSQGRLTRECQRQLKVELLVRNEDIDLDPELSVGCESERRRLCGDEDKSGVEECLKSKAPKLSHKCHQILFRRERIEMEDPTTDFQLQRHCHISISRFCSSSPPAEIIFCLRDIQREVQVEPKCRRLLLKRLQIQNSDYRLNPRLKSACDRDIPKFCSKVISSNHDLTVELDGQMIACLKNQYTKSRLSQSCETEVLAIIRESAANYKLDPVLVKECGNEIEAGCSGESDVEECLKVRFQSKLLKSESCKEQVARLLDEGRADIQSDVLLLKACSNDINALCGDILSGHGRQLSCLLRHLESKPTSISTECRVVLTKRVEMFEFAAQVVPAQSVGQVVRMMADSPARNYFALLAFLAFSLVFFGGIFFARFTHPLTEKNK